MSLAESLIILIIAILILKPRDIEKLTKFLARIYVYCKTMIEQLQTHIDDKVKWLELENNQKRAELADKQYQKNHQE